MTIYLNVPNRGRVETDKMPEEYREKFEFCYNDEDNCLTNEVLLDKENNYCVVLYHYKSEKHLLCPVYNDMSKCTLYCNHKATGIKVKIESFNCNRNSYNLKLITLPNNTNEFVEKDTEIEKDVSPILCPICKKEISSDSGHFMGTTREKLGDFLYLNPNTISHASVYKTFQYIRKPGFFNYCVYKIVYSFNKETHKITRAVYKIAGSTKLFKKILKIEKGAFMNVTHNQTYKCGPEEFQIAINSFLSTDKEYNYIIQDFRNAAKQLSKQLLNTEIDYDKVSVDEVIDETLKEDYTDLKTLARRIMYYKKLLNFKNTSLVYLISFFAKKDCKLISIIKRKKLSEKDMYKFLGIPKAYVYKFMSYNISYRLNHGWFKFAVNGVKALGNPFLMYICFSIQDNNYTKMILDKLEKSVISEEKDAKFENLLDCLKYDLTLSRYSMTFTKKRNLLFQYRLANSTKKLLNEISKYRAEVFVDASNMYAQIKNPTQIDLKNSLSRVHDVLQVEQVRGTKVNKRITKNKDLTKAIENKTVTLEGEKITFKLAKETNDLVIAGRLMNICVGSYSERAIKKQCYIAIGYNAHNEPKICMELTKKEDKYSLVQCKLNHNRRPDIDLSTSINTIMSDNKIYVNTRDLFDGINPLYFANNQEDDIAF